MNAKINSIQDLAAAVRGRRLDVGLSQAALAARANVSRQWVSEFESGKPTAELGLVIRLVDGLGLGLRLGEREEPGSRGESRGARVDLDALLDDYGKR